VAGFVARTSPAWEPFDRNNSTGWLPSERRFGAVSLNLPHYGQRRIPPGNDSLPLINGFKPPFLRKPQVAGFVLFAFQMLKYFICHLSSVVTIL
jgi:hypothetical protein